MAWNNLEMHYRNPEHFRKTVFPYAFTRVLHVQKIVKVHSGMLFDLNAAHLEHFSFTVTEWEWQRREKYNRRRENVKGGERGHVHKHTSKCTEMEDSRRQRCTSGFVHEGEGQAQPDSFLKVNSVINHLRHTRARYQIEAIWLHSLIERRFSPDACSPCSVPVVY